MPTTVLIVPLLIVVLTVAILVLMRRRPVSETSGTTGTAAASGLSLAEENRLLRLQVETLTEALRATAETEVDVEPVDAAEVEVDEVEVAEAEVAEAEVVEVAEFADERVDRPKVSLVKAYAAATAPVLEHPTLEQALAHPVLDDDVARHYADLSRCLAGTGRLRDAVLAMWAADLRRLAPVVGDRAPELCDALGSLAPADLASALTAARAVAGALVGPDVALEDLLDDASHLTHAGPRTPYTPGEASADVLPDDVVDALERVLVTAAVDGADDARVSVGLRCDLVAHVAPGRDRAEVVALVREILEPHERPAYDEQVALVGGAA